MSGFFAAGRWWDVTPDENEMIKGAVSRLSAAGIMAASDEAQALFAAMKTQHSEAYAPHFEGLIARRANREPFSHLLGYRDFYNHRFHVSGDVLDPRPDTETLVGEALKMPFETVLDLGTGSGCILLSLLAERPTANGTGTDISAAALQIAAQNVARLDLGSRARLVQSDWFGAVTGTYDLIVSNPPYIAAIEMNELQPEVRQYEPRLALTDEADGLSCYRAIIAQAPRCLNDAGALLVEIGPTQGPSVRGLMAEKGFAQIAVICDIDGRDRVVSARKPAV